MTKIYLLGCFLGVASIVGAQKSEIQKLSPTNYHTKKTDDNRVIRASEAKGDDETIIYWSEDFSNGFDGMGDNGSWSTSGDQGDLWFHTYPLGAENGYDPTAPLPGDAGVIYGDVIPNWYGGATIPSPTEDNGFMMIDTDRYNSLAVDPDNVGVPSFTTNNPIYAELISPVFDLTGVDNALLTFWHDFRSCCIDYTLNVELSIDGGDTWVPYDLYEIYNGVGNQAYTGEVSIMISDVLQGAGDLSECRLRFIWDPLQQGGMTTYYFQIDDINIISIPENDLTAGTTWYNSYYDVLDLFENTDYPATDYYNEFEYLYSPDYFARPFDFAMDVTNNGTLTQTEVQLQVTITAPDESTTEVVLSDPISLEPGQTDTLRILGYELSSVTPTLQYGNYGFAYEVIQAEEDSRPEDNVGGARGHNISTEAEDEFGIFMNGENSYGGAYTNDGQDRIFGTAMVFSPFTIEDKAITHVEAVFLYSEDFAETIAGEVVYFNVRQGSVLEEDDADPDTETTVFFDSDNPLTYEDGDLEFTIEEDNIWHSADGQPFVWTSFELPTPILIESGVVYQAEYRIPAAGDNVVFSPTPLGDQERYSSLMYDFEDGNWFFLGEAAMPIRFRTGTSTNVEQITYENGVKLTQNYPNPFNDVTRIQYQLDNTEEATFEVFDMTGKLVYSEDLGMVAAGAANVLEFSKGELSSGVYTYSITTAEERVTRKMTIE